MVGRTRIALCALLLGLSVFYVAAASRHGATVNLARGRADQSGYLWDAVAIHQARHGGPDHLIGERNRMPVYPWLLSWGYHPGMSPDQFFASAKRWNTWLSLFLLGVIAAAARTSLPLLATLNLLVVAAFGFFVFKAAYAQVELLFYTEWLLMFLACCHALASHGGKAIVFAGVGGLLAAITHLSKAAVLPFAALFLVVSAMRAGSSWVTLARERAPARNWRRPLADLAVPVVFGVAFLAVLSPYLLNSKRAFGHYFYNVNSTFYVWYDDWPAASQGTYRHGDGVGWPKMPAEEIPSMRKYLREHSAGQIAARIVEGLREMVWVSYYRLWYFKFVAMYVLFAALVLPKSPRGVVELMSEHRALAAFVILYGLTYLLAVAFYKPISGTTLRMLLTHVLPLLVVISWLLTRRPFDRVEWRLGGVSLTPAHFQVFLLATALLDAAFAVWPRLTTDFAGY